VLPRDSEDKQNDRKGGLFTIKVHHSEEWRPEIVPGLGRGAGITRCQWRYREKRDLLAVAHEVLPGHKKAVRGTAYSLRQRLIGFRLCLRWSPSLLTSKGQRCFDTLSL